MGCIICNESSRKFEIQVENRDFKPYREFLYFQCENCETLQLDLQNDEPLYFYPKNYYSFIRQKPILIRMLKKRIDEYAFRQSGLMGGFLAKFFPSTDVEAVRAAYDDGRHDEYTSVLDIGSGSGWLLERLEHLGFKNLTGIDPYIDSDISRGKHVNVYKMQLKEVKGIYDLVISNHSFEHMTDPVLAIGYIKNLLSKKGCAIIRTPVFPNRIWEIYRENWCAIDAPRHIFIPSIKAMKLLAEWSGLCVDRVIF